MDEPAGASVSIAVEVALDATQTFDVFVDELRGALARRGIDFEAGDGGAVRQGEIEIGRIAAWLPGERVTLEWHAAPWGSAAPTRIECRVEAISGGARVTLMHSGWERELGGDAELIGWFAGELAAPLLRAMAPAGLGDWITDRRARRPSGRQARDVYGDPLYHYPSFRVILRELALQREDYLLEIGCGGGVLLKEALESGCRAAAVDHSPDMVQLARATNAVAIAAGRLEVRYADAAHLPFDDDTFTCATMHGVLGFLPDAVAAFEEIRRVLRGGGRVFLLGSDPRLRGTPACPEPMASRLHFYTPAELAALARAAGFDDARVERHDLEQFAREVGIPEEHMPLFTGAGEQFLVAHKPASHGTR